MVQYKTIAKIILSLLLSVATGIVCYYTIANTIAASVLLGIFVFALSEVFMTLHSYTRKLSNENYKEMYESFKKHGISEYHKDFSAIDFKKCIDASRHIKLFLIYSHRFLLHNLTALREFVERDGTSIEIIILDNNSNNPSFAYTCQKFSYTEADLNNRTDEFVRIVNDEILTRKHNRSSVSIYKTMFIPTYALYMFDDYAYITMYRAAPERTNLIPSFRVEQSYDSSLFNFLETDFNDIMKHSATKKVLPM